MRAADQRLCLRCGAALNLRRAHPVKVGRRWRFVGDDCWARMRGRPTRREHRAARLLIFAALAREAARA